MLKGKGKIFLLIITLLFTSQITKAQEEIEIVDGQKALDTSLDFLKK